MSESIAVQPTTPAEAAPAPVVSNEDPVAAALARYQKRVAEQQAAQPVPAEPATGQEQAAEVSAEPAAQSEGQEAPAQETPAEDLTSLRLRAAKAERRAREEAKRARELTGSHQRIQEAAKNWQANPFAVVEAMGLDKKAFFDGMVKAVLQEPDVDPQKASVEQQIKAAIRPYIEDLERERSFRAQQEENLQVAQVVAQKIIPVLDADRHETLLANFGGNKAAAATHIMDAVRQHWNDNGELIPFEEAADQLEQFHEESVRKALETLQKSKKYGGKFQAPSQPPTSNGSPPRTAQLTSKAPSPKTLTSKQGATVSTSPPAPRKTTGDVVVDNVLNKFGL